MIDLWHNNKVGIFILRPPMASYQPERDVAQMQKQSNNSKNDLSQPQGNLARTKLEQAINDIDAILDRCATNGYEMLDSYLLSYFELREDFGDKPFNRCSELMGYLRAFRQLNKAETQNRPKLTYSQKTISALRVDLINLLHRELAGSY